MWYVRPVRWGFVVLGVATVLAVATTTRNTASTEVLWDDFALESAVLILAMVASYFLFELEVYAIELGWLVFTYSLVIDVLDEVYVLSPVVGNLTEDLLRIVGLGLLVIGLYTSQRRLQSGIERLDERMMVFNRVLRHDVRNAVSVITTRADLLADEPDLDREQIREHARSIRKTAYEIADVSDRVRRVEATLTAERDHRSRQDLSALVEQLVAKLQSDYPEADVTVDCPENAPVLASDLLDIAVENLLENAFEHNDSATPTVRVSVTERPEREETVLEVDDDGPGIPAEEIDTIVERNETPLRHTSGLGLWVANWIVTESEGDLSFETPPEGGTVVSVTLPCDR